MQEEQGPWLATQQGLAALIVGLPWGRSPEQPSVLDRVLLAGLDCFCLSGQLLKHLCLAGVTACPSPSHSPLKKGAPGTFASDHLTWAGLMLGTESASLTQTLQMQLWLPQIPHSPGSGLPLSSHLMHHFWGSGVRRTIAPSFFGPALQFPSWAMWGQRFHRDT